MKTFVETRSERLWHFVDEHYDSTDKTHEGQTWQSTASNRIRKKAIGFFGPSIPEYNLSRTQEASKYV